MILQKGDENEEEFHKSLYLIWELLPKWTNKRKMIMGYYNE